MSEQEDILNQFTELTQTPETVARSILERNNWDIEDALNDFYNGPTHRRAPQPSQEATKESTHKVNKPKPKPTFKSFSQLIDQDEQDEDDEEQLFAGGGNGSGLNVENPNNPHNLVQDLLKKAEEGGSRPRDEGDEPPKPSFNGVGYTLGDGNTPSRAVGAPSFISKRLEKAHRRITFWKNGFQVGEGELFRYDDPANASYLAELNAGRAPLSLLNVEYGQEVDVEVAKNLDQEYQPPKRKIGGFQGAGHRLGSPVSPDYEQSNISTISDNNSQSKESQEKPKEEEQIGDSTVQIRFADGRRVVHKFNSTDPVEVVYNFVKGQTTDTRVFTLNYSFPVKPIEDLKQTIKEAGIANAVVIQRWVQ